MAFSLKLNGAIQYTKMTALGDKPGGFKDYAQNASMIRQIELRFPNAFKFLSRYSRLMMRQNKSNVYLEYQASSDWAWAPVLVLPAILLAGGLAAVWLAVYNKVLLWEDYWTNPLSGGGGGGGE